MSDRTVFLRGPRYVLGETEAGYTTIEDLPGRAAELHLPLNADLWGWGSFWRTSRSLEEMATESGSASLSAAGVPPSSIEALVLCSTRVPGTSEDHGAFMEAVLTGIGLADIPFYGLTLNRCTNLLAAIDIATAFVLSGRYRRLLVITTDKVEHESERLAGYALFSDGSASCVLTSDESHDGYEVLSCANAQETASLEWSKEISSALARQVNEDLLLPFDMKLEEVSGLMSLNIFKPLVVMKELQAGFSAGQLYTANIPRTGHCFSADPLVNLVDSEAAGRVRGGNYYVLAASVPGSRYGVLLRKLAE
jgi:3-oxoacyl-[acyl-carrier-protein] synthase III